MMGISTQTITVDLSKQLTRPQVVRLGQGDKRGTTLVADIYENGVAYNLNGKTARFSMRAPDGTSSYSATASSYSGNKATFNIDETYAASIAGKTDTAYIEVLSGSTVICSTSRITVIVLRSASQGLPVSGAYSDALEEAISSAQSAASSANSAASNANTKATRAESAATNANTARDNANTAASAANTAASAATTAAGNANSAASAATSAKDAANAAASAANTAASSANTATNEANAAIEAMGDISELAVPEMTANVRGGAKVGGSTQVIGGKLEVKLSESATGTSVTTGSTSALRELQVHGKSIQDGTPTPDAPVEVQVVSTANLYHQTLRQAGDTWQTVGANATYNADGTCTVTGTTTTTAWLWGGGNSKAPELYTMLQAGAYTVCGSHNVAVQTMVDDTVTTIVPSGTVGHRSFTLSEPTLVKAVPVILKDTTLSNETVWVAVYEGADNVLPYIPYGSIGILIGDTLTPIDLQGNTLASLPDGTRDELHVNSAGHVWIEKQVKRLSFNGDITPTLNNTSSTLENWVIAAGTVNDWKYTPNRYPKNLSSRNTIVNSYPLEELGFASAPGEGISVWADGIYLRTVKDKFADGAALQSALQAHPVEVWYQLANPQTIDLGYIDPPAIPSGSVVTISASLTPTFDLDCWTEHASELADATATLANEISSLRAQIAALATS